MRQRYFDGTSLSHENCLKSRGLTFDGLTPDELVAQRLAFVNSTRLIKAHSGFLLI